MKLLLPLADIRLRISWPYMSKTKESPSLKNEWICLRICVKKFWREGDINILGHFLGEVGRSKLLHFELKGTMKKIWEPNCSPRIFRDFFHLFIFILSWQGGRSEGTIWYFRHHEDQKQTKNVKSQQYWFQQLVIAGREEWGHKHRVRWPASWTSYRKAADGAGEPCWACQESNTRTSLVWQIKKRRWLF